MSREYEVKKHSDGRVIVVLHAECQISREELLSLLVETGVDPEKVVFITPKDALSYTGIDDELVIIPLDSATCDTDELELAARHCGNSGAQVIAVFGSEFSYTGLHPIADKYGTQSGWSSSDLLSCIKGTDEENPEDRSGSEAIRPIVRQVDC